MSIYNDLVKNRLKHEEDLLAYSFQNIARSIVGKEQASYGDGSVQAVAQILKYYDIKEKDIPSGYTELEDILDYQLSTSGVMYRDVSLEKGWQNEAIGVFLATIKESNQAVALFPSTTGKYEYCDPNTGKKKRVTSRFANTLSKKAICFYRPFPQRPIKIIDLIIYLKDCITMWDIASYILAMAAVTAVGLLLPKINHIMTGPVVEYGSYQLLYAVALFAICFLIGSTLCGVIKQLLLNRVQYKMSENVRAATLMRLLSLPANFFKNYTSGELNQYLEYMNTLCSSMVNLVISSGLTGAFSLVYIVQIFDYAPSLVVPSLVISLLTLLVSILTTRVQIVISREKMKITAKERGLIFSLIKGIQKIRISGSENRAFAKWANLYAQEASYTYNPPALIMYSTVITAAITMLGTIVMYFVAVTNNVSISDYYAFNASYAYVSSAFTSIASIAATVGSIKPTLDLIRPLLQSDIEIKEDKEPVTSIRGGVEISHMSFRYDDNLPLIADDLCLKIKPQEYVAIVGKTGCGKSTLVRLLLGFDNPVKGSIFYDNKDTKRINMQMLRRNIGTVTQDGRLFEGSIYDNIVITKPSLTVDEAWEAAEIAGIADDIRAMPMGMHTRVLDSTGGGLSGGQRQRLLIARAIAPKPKLLIFDEATSALDNITQKQVAQSIDKMKCTRIVIAHRISTIINCDRILVMEDGKIAEEGTYDELLEKNGTFAELVSSQTL